MAELPRLGRTTRTTLVSITSLRGLQRLLLCNLVVGLASLSAVIWVLR